jgi:hypothetical protein
MAKAESKAKEVKSQFLVKTESNELKTVSARIPIELYDQFYKAVEIAKENGFDLTITHVVQVAMQNAIKDVKNTIGEEKMQGNLPV